MYCKSTADQFCRNKVTPQLSVVLGWQLALSSILIASRSGFADDAPTRVPRFAMTEVTLRHSGTYTNPYTDLAATADLSAPGGGKRSIPMFWDSGTTWKLRMSPPDEVGRWGWKITSPDPGLNDVSGSFEVSDSNQHGGLRSMRGHPYHFEGEDGTPFWFFGDTAWALFTDSREEQHTESVMPPDQQDWVWLIMVD